MMSSGRNSPALTKPQGGGSIGTAAMRKGAGGDSQKVQREKDEDRWDDF